MASSFQVLNNVCFSANRNIMNIQIFLVISWQQKLMNTERKNIFCYSIKIKCMIFIFVARYLITEIWILLHKILIFPVLLLRFISHNIWFNLILYNLSSQSSFVISMPSIIHQISHLSCIIVKKIMFMIASRT